MLRKEINLSILLGIRNMYRSQMILLVTSHKRAVALSRNRGTALLIALGLYDVVLSQWHSGQTD